MNFHPHFAVRIRFPLVALFVLLARPFAQATDFFVATTGNDQTGNGTRKKPYVTLAWALSRIPADKNHTLHLGPGVFSVKKQLLVPSGVNLIGAGYERTQVRCENFFDIQTTAKKGLDWQGAPALDPKAPETATLVFNGKNQTVRGIGFDGVGKKTIAPILIVYGENFVFDGIYSHDFGVSGWWLHEGRNVTLRHSKFKNNSFGNFNQDYGAVQFHRVDNLFIHDNRIDESDTHAYGIKMASKDQENMWSKKDKWQTGTVNDNIQIYNNVINVGEVGSWGVPGQPDSKVPTFTIEFNSDIECRAKIHHNWLNNNISIVSWEKGQDTRYEIYNNLADFRKPDGTLNKYAYFVETNLDHFDIHHNVVISGYYPLANWVDGRNTDCKIHHNVFYAAFGRKDLSFFQYGAGFDGYQFFNNTVIDLLGVGKLFEVRTKKAGNLNAAFKNNIFYAANPRGDVLGDSSAVNGVVENNLFYNLSPRGQNALTANPSFVFNGPLDSLGYYALQPGSPAIDAGVEIPGITGGYAGKAPDLGAVETGVTPWTAGPSGGNKAGATPPRPALGSPGARRVPLAPDTSRSLQYAWDRKNIRASEVIDGMESLENWEYTPLYAKTPSARVSLSGERVRAGKTALKFVSPTKLPFRLKTGERYWDWQFLTRKFNKAERGPQDFTKYNRISVWIYPDFKGHPKPYLMLVLNNEGNVPDRFFRDGIHAFTLKNGQWNKVVMEIEHLPRNRVTGISLVYRLQGNEAGAADTVAYYADQLTLESVPPDPYKGWHTAGAIAFSHSGYNVGSAKTAFTSQAGPARFRVVDARNGKTVLTRAVQRQTSRVGTFTVFDFSGLRTAGNYRLEYGTQRTEPFPVGEDVWRPALEKSLNQFFVQRCGYALPGIHGACHRNWYTVYEGDTVRLTGGWHDAGDLSQSYTNTANATAILFKLARKYRPRDPELADRLLDEGLWGLTWLHTNRFPGGRRVSWSEIDHYSDGIRGNLDDVAMPPPTASRGVEPFFGVLANAQAALTLKDDQAERAAKATRYALEDWQFATSDTTRWDADDLAMAVLAGATLFELLGDTAVQQQAIAYAERLLRLQETAPQPWTLPLSGFFYTNGSKNRVFGYNHGFTVAAPTEGLVALCRLFPNHPAFPAWREAIRLYANYLKTTAGLTAPYYMVPANVYRLGHAADDVSVADGDAQVKQGIRLDDEHYLRMFPVWGMFRGNNPNVLSRGIGLASANQLLKDPDLERIARAQLEWVVGKNPFGQSQLYGEGYRFSPQYAVMTGDIVGGIPVGILTDGDGDEPYCQASIFCNYKEVWGHCSIRFLELLDYLQP